MGCCQTQPGSIESNESNESAEWDGVVLGFVSRSATHFSNPLSAADAGRIAGSDGGREQAQCQDSWFLSHSAVANGDR